MLGVNWASSLNAKNLTFLGLHTRYISPSFASTLDLNTTSEECLLEQLDNLKPSVVINTIGLADVDLCEKDPCLAYRVNTSIPLTIAKVCHSLSIRFVHISTDHLYSGTTSFSTENEQPHPINTYAKTKLMADQLILSNNPNALIVRANFFGWGTSYRKSFSDYILDALNTGNNLRLPSNVYFTPILATTLARLTHRLIDAQAKGIYNISSDNRVSKYEFAMILAEIFGYKNPSVTPYIYSCFPDKAPRPLDMSLSNHKTHTELSYQLGSVEQQVDHLKVEFHTGIRDQIKSL